jgi:uncharacterized protein (TIGR02001 family)
MLTAPGVNHFISNEREISMRKSLLSLSMAVVLAAPILAAAETPPPVTGNMTITSDYRFRGISQTYLGPAIQGGADYAHASGLYFGNWNSSVSALVYTEGSGIEMDFYGGYRKSFGDIGIDVGTIYYWYPRAKAFGETFDNWEVYAGASWKWVSGKLFYALSDYFGLNDTQANNYWIDRNTGAPLGARGNSRGTYYLDLTATVPLTKELGVVAHYGMLEVEKYGELDYNDWKLGVTYDLQGWIFGAAYVDSDAKNEWYYTTGSRGAKDSGKAWLVFSVTKTF